MEIKRIVVKIGTSCLTYETGKLNIRRIESLVKVISDIQNRGKQVVLVSSGAVGVGTGKLGLTQRPNTVIEKQAVAAVGQCELMFLYQKLFSEYGYTVGQILMTKDVVDTHTRKTNVINTFNKLFEMDVIPVVNENDSISVEEIEFGDNDTLSAVVAGLVKADMLVMLTDIDGLYTANPAQDKNAQLISEVEEITDQIKSLAGGVTSNRGTGGMITKLTAAQIATDAGVDTIIASGKDPQILYKIMEGMSVGTIFRRSNIF